MWTKEDFDVEISKKAYGPVWTVTPKENGVGLYHVRYVLKSTINMKHIKGWKKEPGVHLYIQFGDDPHTASGNWKGAYRTWEMQEAFDSLIADLNRNVELEAIEQAISSPMGELRIALSLVDDATEKFATKDIEDVMEQVSDAYTALMLQYQSAIDSVEEKL